MKSSLTELLVPAAIGAALGLAACASSPVPYEKIAVAKAAVQSAEQNGAPAFAPVELATATDKLNRAEKAASDHDAQPAIVLAEQATVDAQLAEATAGEQRSHKAAMEFDANLQALQQESMRSSSTPSGGAVPSTQSTQ